MFMVFRYITSQILIMEMCFFVTFSFVFLFSSCSQRWAAEPRKRHHRYSGQHRNGDCIRRENHQTSRWAEYLTSLMIDVKNNKAKSFYFGHISAFCSLYWWFNIYPRAAVLYLFIYFQFSITLKLIHFPYLIFQFLEWNWTLKPGQISSRFLPATIQITVRAQIWYDIHSIFYTLTNIATYNTRMSGKFFLLMSISYRLQFQFVTVRTKQGLWDGLWSQQWC